LSLVVDASVVYRLLFKGPESDLAEQIVSKGEVIVPDLLYVEVANVAWKYVRFQGLSPALAALAIDQLLQIPFTIADSRPVLTQALAIAIEFERSANDSIYLAIARAWGVEMITADVRLVNSLRGTALERHVKLLGS
jgi:predicted nucleic acid-binding protein